MIKGTELVAGDLAGTARKQEASEQLPNDGLKEEEEDEEEEPLLNEAYKSDANGEHSNEGDENNGINSLDEFMLIDEREREPWEMIFKDDAETPEQVYKKQIKELDEALSDAHHKADVLRAILRSQRENIDAERAAFFDDRKVWEEEKSELVTKLEKLAATTTEDDENNNNNDNDYWHRRQDEQRRKWEEEKCILIEYANDLSRNYVELKREFEVNQRRWEEVTEDLKLKLWSTTGWYEYCFHQNAQYAEERAELEEELDNATALLSRLKKICRKFVEEGGDLNNLREEIVDDLQLFL